MYRELCGVLGRCCPFRQAELLYYLLASRSHAFSREEKAWYNAFAAYSANQSDVRKRVTSRNTPTRTYYTLSEILSWQLSPHKSLYCTPTIHVYVYSRQRIHTYSFMGNRIRDSAVAVHEAAATLGFTLKKEPLRRDMMSL